MGTGNTAACRAIAAIEPGVVCLRNPWLERRWSTFTGATTELLMHGVAGDSLTRKSPEYHIDYGGRPLAVTDLGDVAWSESCDAYGATVTLTQQGPSICLCVHTFLSHDRPGMVRHVELTNTGPAPVPLTRVAPDILPLDPERFRVPPVKANAATNQVALGEHLLHYRAVHHGPGTLLMGSPAAEGFALFAPNPRYCATVWRGLHELEPGKSWAPPPAALYWIAGGADATLTAGLNALHAEWQEHISGNEKSSQAGY